MLSYAFGEEEPHDADRRQSKLGGFLIAVAVKRPERAARPRAAEIPQGVDQNGGRPQAAEIPRGVDQKGAGVLAKRRIGPLLTKTQRLADREPGGEK